MKTILTLALLTSFSSFAASSNNLICSGVKSHSSPYPGAHSKTSSSLRADTTKRTGTITLNRSASFGGGESFKLERVTALASGNSVAISALDKKTGDLVDLKISLFGKKGPRLSGTIGSKKVNFRCSANLKLDI